MKQYYVINAKLIIPSKQFIEDKFNGLPSDVKCACYVAFIESDNPSLDFRDLFYSVNEWYLSALVHVHHHFIIPKSDLQYIPVSMRKGASGDTLQTLTSTL